ncbi:MAG: hypothetical protein AAB521_04360 [Patescibacteria group bacterium]
MPKFITRFLRQYEAQIIIVAIILLIFNPYSRAFYKSVLLITDLIPNSKIQPLKFFSKEPILKEVSYKSGNEEIYADLYIPNSRGKHPAAVLQIGLDIDKSDPRIAKIASSIARTGIIILVPNIPTISQRRLTRDSPREFADSYKYLISLDNLVDQNKTGFMTFCGASGPAFISAQSPDLKTKVDFFVTIDPYYDLNDLYKEITTKQINGKPWAPHAKTVEVFNREAIFQLEDEDDKRILSDLLVSIGEEKLSRGEYEKVDPEIEFETEEAKATYFELTNTDPEKSDYYLSNAPQKQKDYLKALSASTYVKDFRPKVFILSEKPSPYLPYTHAEGYHKNIKDSVFQEVSFATADLNPKISLIDAAKSFYFLWRVLGYLES